MNMSQRLYSLTSWKSRNERNTLYYYENISVSSRNFPRKCHYSDMAYFILKILLFKICIIRCIRKLTWKHLNSSLPYCTSITNNQILTLVGLRIFYMILKYKMFQVKKMTISRKLLIGRNIFHYQILLIKIRYFNVWTWSKCSIILIYFLFSGLKICQDPAEKLKPYDVLK